MNINDKIGTVVRQETDAVAVQFDAGERLVPLDQLRDAGNV